MGSRSQTMTVPVETISNNFSNLSTAPAMSSFTEYQAAMAIVKWIFPLVIFIGTIGNILAFTVLLTKRMRITSVNVYLAYLALADTIILYLSGFKTWIRVLTDWELLQVSNSGCKIIMFLILLSLHVAAWLIVCVSLDRFVAIWFPFTSKSLCTPSRARIVCGAITVTLAAYNSYAFWLIGLRAGGDGRMQCRGGSDSYFMSMIQPWMKLYTYSCIPFVIVFILNTCIIIKVVPGFKHSGRHQNEEQVSRSTSRNIKDKRLTAMLICISVSWLILSAPMMLWTFVATPHSDGRAMAKNHLAKTVGFLLMYINHGLNFYLYCLSGRRFRKALRDLLKCNHSFKYFPKESESSMRTFRTTLRPIEQ